MQEAMMYAPWPITVLQHDKFKREWDDKGKLVFRGPRCGVWNVDLGGRSQRF